MMSKTEIRRARVTRVVMVTLTLLTVIAYVYAFLQLAEAKRQVQISIELAEQVAAAKAELEGCCHGNKSSD